MWRTYSYNWKTYSWKWAAPTASQTATLSSKWITVNTSWGGSSWGSSSSKKNYNTSTYNVDPSVLHDAQVNWLTQAQIDAKRGAGTSNAVKTYDKTYWTNSFKSWGWSSSTNPAISSTINSMKFWNDVKKSWGSYDLSWRNQQIADLMKKNNIAVTDAKSVRDFLEMYSPSFASSTDEDKNNTASNILNLYNWYNVDNESPINDVDEDRDLDEYMNEEFNIWEEETNPRDEEKQAYEDKIADLESQIFDYQNQKYEDLNNKVDETFNNEEEKKWLSDEQKAANEAASAAAWNSAQWINNTETTEPTNVSTNEQPVVNSENYWERWTKIMNVLWNLWYKIDTAPSEQAAEAEVSNVLEWWETAEQADTQAQIAESNATEWEVTPEYTDEAWLVSSYEKAFDDLLAGWSTPENVQKAIDTYLQAKDAAALFTVQNNLSDEAYKNMLKKIKWNKSLRVLLQNYNK